MRFFLCTFEYFLLGIPVDTVSSLIIYPEEVRAVITRDADGGDWYFSIPHFFGLEEWCRERGGERSVWHGVILKPPFQPASGGRSILLAPPVEREVDIPPEEIRGLPKILWEWGPTDFYTGIRFDESTMTAFINPASLIVRIIKDHEGDFHD